MFAVDWFQRASAYIGDDPRNLRASSGLAECHGVLFRAEQVLVGAMGWWSGPTNAVETDRQARVFGLILYYLCDVKKLLNLEPPSPFFKTSKNSCNGTL